MQKEYVFQKEQTLLEERGWTLYRLAKESGVSYSTLKNLFQRGGLPSIPILMRICEGFGISLSEFFYEENMSMSQLDISDQQFLADFHSLQKSDRQLVMDCISYGFCDCNAN